MKYFLNDSKLMNCLQKRVVVQEENALEFYCEDCASQQAILLCKDDKNIKYGL